MTRIVPLTETTDPTAVTDQAILYSKDVAGVTHFFVRLSDGTIIQLSGVTGTTSPIVTWTAAKTWTQVYAEITSFASKCVVLIEPSGANRNITTGTYDINGVRFIGMPQLTAATVGYGAVKVVVDAAVTFSQDGTTLFAVISSQDVFWYFDAAVQPVTANKIRIRLDGGKMHADSGAVFTGIDEARVFLTGGAHLQGYSNAADALIQLADAATCVIESYAGRVMKDIVNTPGTAFSATVTLWTDPASVVFINGSGGWFRSANTTPTYKGFWDSSISLDANALALVSPNGSLHRLSVDNDGRWSNGAGMLLGRQIFTASGTYTPTAGTTMVRVRQVGAGGGGGGAGTDGASTGGSAGGGASGAYFELFIDPSASITGGAVTIGAAGAAGANTGGTGGTGGDTSVVIQTITYTAKGGLGGVGQNATFIAGGRAVAGGAPQAGSSAGDVVAQQAGFAGIMSSGGTMFVSGMGGSSPLGAGGRSVVATSADGFAGQGFGAGGGGGSSLDTITASLGGVGTAGLLIIEEYSG